ncbi:hypothetical protein EMIT0111MI5_20527 [Burkholderia sp. IT-111MI5]
MSVECDDCAYDAAGAARRAVAVAATAAMVTMMDFTVSSDDCVAVRREFASLNRRDKFRNPDRPDKWRFLTNCVPE